MRPLMNKHEDESSWRHRSSTGFLDDSEEILKLILDDWISVENLSTNHVTLSVCILSLLEKAQTIRVQNNLSQFCPVAINDWNISRLQTNKEVIVVDSIRFNAPQLSPFAMILDSTSCPQNQIFTKTLCNKGLIPTFVDGLNANEVNSSLAHTNFNSELLYSPWGWDIDHILTNETLGGLNVCITDGIIGMISEIGFFEGGESICNPYRVNPFLLSAVLGGTVHPKAVEIALQTGRTKAQMIINETEKAIKEAIAFGEISGDSGRDKEEESVVAWISNYQKNQTEKAQLIVSEWKTIAGRLYERSQNPIFQHVWEDFNVTKNSISTPFSLWNFFKSFVV